ncbi:PH domain-containing protein [Candidatus Nanohalobium constans]|uniref:Putative membrane protein YdbS, contains bPH2 n=1 Tax=Candidatus Nanohalobium constans TaxID=2565781 RepID=A0A5Q0UG74_9ARCH|nr:PH domain-containing protein [Candidatus Nanohalobium constans]QGA80652.1 putative membrane protein YdbS, contains bPH2 [Candidatus Nanohalobium constans]
MKDLEKKILAPWLATGLLVSIVLTSIVGGSLVFLETFSISVASVLFAVLTVLTSVYMVLRYRNWGFEMRDDYLYLEHGVVTKVKTKVPYVRVQHVDTQRSLVDRIFGLSQLVVYTAGSRGADVGIPGLLPADADDIQERLRKVAVESEEEFGDAV